MIPNPPGSADLSPVGRSSGNGSSGNACTFWYDGYYCGAAPIGFYLPGHRCAAHTPAAVAGRPEVTPDPARTVEGLRRRAGLPLAAALALSTSSLTDERAVASGKRRSSTHTHRAARNAEESRKVRR